MINKPKYFRTNKSVKTVFIEVFEWFDRVNGNSYCSCIVTINDGMKNGFKFSIPFTYGYGNYGEQITFETLIKSGILTKEYTRKNWINDYYVVKTIKHEKCLKREVTQAGNSCPKGYMLNTKNFGVK